MNIVNIRKSYDPVLYVETDDEINSLYRRVDGEWDNLIGDSWEPVHDSREDELEHKCWYNEP